MANLKEKYKESVVPALTQKFGYSNPMLVPKLEKVVVNMAFGIVDKDTQKSVVDDLTKITGQKPVFCKARKSVSNFKLREGMVIGAKVTLRGARMYDFFEKLVHVVMPQLRDFRGISPDGFDGRGNFSLGLKEQIIFPEIEYDKIDALRGMNVTITTSAKTDAEAKALLSAFRFPFKN